jgi:hypothetical protein
MIIGDWFDIIDKVSSGSGSSIFTFTIPIQTGSTTIIGNTINLPVLVGADVSALVPTFTISSGATLSDVTGNYPSYRGAVLTSGSSYLGSFGVLTYNVNYMTLNITSSVGSSTTYTINLVPPSLPTITYSFQTLNITSGAPLDLYFNQPSNPSAVFIVYNSITTNTVNHHVIAIGNENPTPGPNNTADGTNVIGNYFNYTGTIYPYYGGGDANETVLIGHNINALIKYNFVYNGQYNFSVKGSGYTNTAGAIAYNVLTGSWTMGTGSKGIGGTKFINNTYYNAQTSGVVASVYINSNSDNGPSYPSPNCMIRNCIFYSTTTSARFIYIDNPSTSGFTSDYNIFYCPADSLGTTSTMFRIAGTSQLDYTFAQWQALGYDTHSVWMNPNFLDTVNCIPTSPLYNAISISGLALGLDPKATWPNPLRKIQVSIWQNGAWIVAGVIPSASITPGSYTYSNSGGSNVFNYTCNVGITVQFPSWLSITGASSYYPGAGSFSLSTNSSNSGSTLTGTINIVQTSNISNILATVSVIQNGASSISVTGVTISPSSASINYEQTQQLIPSISPSNATNKNVTYSTGNSSVLTVNSTGLVTPTGLGTTNATVTTLDGGYIDSSSITITPFTLPTNTLTATAINNTEIDLSWNSDSLAINYHLYWNLTASWSGGSGWNFIEGDITGTSYQHTGLTPNTTYYYFLYDRNNTTTILTSNPGAAANATTLNVGTQLSTPSLSLSSVSSSEIDVTWTQISNNLGYTLQRSLDGTSGWSTVGNLGTNNNYDNDTGLTASTTYYYRVLAIGSGTYSNSNYSSIQSSTTQSGGTGSYQVYLFSWNGIGTYVQGNWNYHPDQPGTSGSPTFTYGGSGNRWGDNTNSFANNSMSTSVVRHAGQSSIHLIVDPLNPSISTNPPSNDTLTNYRSEIYLNPFDAWIPVGTEVWISWSYFYPYLSSILDPSHNLADPFSECVLRQWSPFMGDAGPQIALVLNRGYATNLTDIIGNSVLIQNQSWNNAYYWANNLSLSGNSTTAAGYNYGHIVPGVWMDFVEHTIIDDTGSNGGCYQLWVTIPPTSTSGYPTNLVNPSTGHVYTDCQYSNYSGTHLWYNFNDVPTTRHSYGSGVFKIGIYNGGQGWHNTKASSSNGTDAYSVAAASISAMQAQDPGNPGRMEVYIGPIRLEYNSGTITKGGTIYNTLSGNITGNFIDSYGQQYIQPS